MTARGLTAAIGIPPNSQRSAARAKIADEFTLSALVCCVLTCYERTSVRKTRPTSETEFASVKLAFFHRITAWANALENRDPMMAREELRHIEVLSERLLQDDLFIQSAASKQLKPSDLVGCLTAYLCAITDSMPYPNGQAAPASDDVLAADADAD